MMIEQKFKWTLTGLIIMVLLNIATLLAIWLNGPDVREWKNGPTEKPGSIIQSMNRQLELTDAQTDTVQALQKAHFKQMRVLRSSLDERRTQYFRFIMSEEGADETKKDSLFNELTLQFSALESAMYEHMMDMKSILSEQQQQEFQKMIQQNFSRGHKKNRKMGH